jgi:hypothetical protein
VSRRGVQGGSAEGRAGRVGCLAGGLSDSETHQHGDEAGEPQFLSIGILIVNSRRRRLAPPGCATVGPIANARCLPICGNGLLRLLSRGSLRSVNNHGKDE